MRNKIIDFIKRNRVSSTQVADCLDKTGALTPCNAINEGHFAVGKVKYIYAANSTNYDVHKQIESVEDGDVVFVDVFDSNEQAVFGDLVSKFLILYRQSCAIVTNGKLRDAPKLLKENWPIWCNGFTPEGFINDGIPLTAKQLAYIENQKKRFEGAVAVCDDTGVTVIPKERHNQDFIDALIHIEEQEDIWFDCIDRKKFTTFETVCLKRYLDDEQL